MLERGDEPQVVVIVEMYLELKSVSSLLLWTGIISCFLSFCQSRMVQNFYLSWI